MTIARHAISLGLMAAASLVSGCQLVGGDPPTTSAFAPKVEPVPDPIEVHKDELIRQLAHCESGGWGPSDRPIYGGRGAYLGRLQFTISTAIAYQQKRDGTRLTREQAIALAHDYDQAASLAKYMIFELEEPWHWPVCSRKISLRSEMVNLKKMSADAAQARTQKPRS